MKDYGKKYGPWIITAALTAVVLFMLSACTPSDAKVTESTSATETTTAKQTESTAATTTTAETTTVPEETTKATVPAAVAEGLTGNWSCEDLASDGKTDTGFYAMYIKRNGYFSLYDQEAGNPGISGFMKNDSGTSVDCVFETDDFDVPSCWKLKAEGDTLNYELDGDTLKLGHNDVWIIFRRGEDDEDEDIVYEHLPRSLDELMTFDVPKGYLPDMKYKYNDEEWNPVVQRAYSNENEGAFSVAIFSFEGYDCLGDYEQKIDVEDSISRLKDKREIDIGGQTGYIGTKESDDTEDMVAVAYVTYGDYVFEFRFTNFDDVITEKQMKTLEKIAGSVKFN